MKLMRLAAGRYMSNDLRVTIDRLVATTSSVCWAVKIDGKLLVSHPASKHEAVDLAKKAMAK